MVCLGAICTYRRFEMEKQPAKTLEETTAEAVSRKFTEQGPDLPDQHAALVECNDDVRSSA